MLPFQARVDLGRMAIRGTSSLNCFVSYPGHSLGDLALCRGAFGVFYSPSQLSHNFCKSSHMFEHIYIYIYIYIYIHVNSYSDNGAR